MEKEYKSKKEIAMAFLNLVVSGKIDEGYDLYVAEEFRHHNPYFKGDRQSLLNAMKENAIANPDKIFEIKRTLQDGNLVAVHSHVRQNPGDPGAAVVHIFRFFEDRIVELWDVGMPAPKDNINENGIF